MESALKIILPIYVIIFYVIAFAWRTYAVTKKTGIKAYVLPNTDDVHGYLSRGYRLVSLVSVSVVILYISSENIYQYLSPFYWLQTPFLTYLGLGILALSLIWIIIAQNQMGNSWRIGIDFDHKTSLVSEGIFKLSRNPVFLGMRVTYIGFFLVLPNAVTLMLWVWGDVLLQVQVRLEETYLRELHGDEYQQYCQQTGRWL